MSEKITRHTPLDQLPQWLTPEETAAFLGLGLTSVYQMIRGKEIEARKFGRLYRIPRTVLMTGAGNGR